MANVDFYDVTIIYQSMARNGGFQPSDLGKQDFWDIRLEDHTLLKTNMAPQKKERNVILWGYFMLFSNRKIVPQTHSAKIACVWDKVILDTVPTTRPIVPIIGN